VQLPLPGRHADVFHVPGEGSQDFVHAGARMGSNRALIRIENVAAGARVPGRVIHLLALFLLSS
jgi:hypothetical protein